MAVGCEPDDPDGGGADGGQSGLIWENITDGGIGDSTTADAGNGQNNNSNCDEDNDGFESEICGGTDCDDSRAHIHPQAQEKCSFDDENCNGSNNELLDCSFVAAGPDNMYRVDPFAPKVEWLFTVDHRGVSGGMLDIDIDPDGQLLVVKKTGLYQVDESDFDFPLVTAGNFQDGEGAAVELSSFTNGMAINSAGKIFLTNSEKNFEADPVESAALAHTVERETGVVSVLGSLWPYISSGDCVALKDDSILMTAKEPANSDANDLLVKVDATTAQTTLIGDTGYPRIFGLSASFGYLFGVTEDAKILKLDEQTGSASIVLDCGEQAGSQCPEPPPGESSIRFWGAANGD